MNHASTRLITGYARGDDLPGDQVWALEAHLETCAFCREALASASEVSSLVESVWAGLEPSLTYQATPARRFARWLSTWATPVMLPWLVMIGLVTVVAVVFDHFVGRPTDGVTAVQLFAPVLPVLGVAASWARGIDPAYELVAATPRAGLYLIFRRTTAVLAVVLPVLLVAGWLTGTGFALWLLPSLAFTSGTLALGGLIGISRAAYTLVAVWGALLVLPTVAQQGHTFALSSAAMPIWAGIFALTTVIVALHKGAFTRLGAHH